jgi:DNA mismatch endonuclease (patch repair protein)
MMDTVSPERRSAIMGATQGKNTRPELIVRRAAHRLGLRFRLHDKRLPGRPDLVFTRWKTVVFVNGCYWHRHPGCRRTTTPKSNTTFWNQKFFENSRRDADNYNTLRRCGWRVLILWECQVKTAEQASEIIQAEFPGRRPPV